jgi:Domain of unknown function (DUF927)
MTAGGERFVTTADIRAAIKGRKTELLDALKIPWGAGNPHIRCPYPGHSDANPSWRWDRRKNRAYCTCITGSHDVLGVLMAVEPVTLEAAKIRGAEILGRLDLIRVRIGNKPYQRHDAHSLLNPPASNRDAELPFIYLGSRLGIEPADVPRPATPVAGIKSLEFFDPPAGPRAKPKLVGSHPCAIFGTVATNGRTHAHRIYLSPDGRAKADLGIGPDGKRRDPKKSAKRTDGQGSTAGCAVIWGNPEKARHAILFEGIENGAVGAVALRPEIEADEIYVASGITAGGVEAFEPYPAAELVTVGADRDEAKEGAGYQRGERAARTCAMRNRDRIDVRIGLPGGPGESTDWLKIFLQDGVEAARSGLLGATPFVPTKEEIERSRQATTKAQYVKSIAEVYPLPTLETLRLEYRFTRGGEVWVHKLVGEKSDVARGEEVAVWAPVCSPVGVPALLRKADEDDTYGLRVCVQDMSGQPRTVDFDRAELARLGASEIRARLLEAGLRVEGDGESIVTRVLKAAKPSDCITVVSRPGWHRLPEPVFVTPAGETIGAPEGVRFELAASTKLADGVSSSGTIEGWQAAVRSAVTAGNCPHWTLSAAAGFAGVLVDLTKSETCGLNLSGSTSLGKTTGQRIGVSAWSSPKQSDGGLLKSMRATENAIEPIARDSSGTILALDEMAHADGKVIGRVIYSIAGDVGKARMRRDGSLRRSQTWSTFALLSSEKSLEQKIRDDGGQWTGGMAARLPDVDVTGVNSRVAPKTIDALNLTFAHYGHAGPAFVRALVANGLHKDLDLLNERIKATARALAGADADSAKIRAATPFAFLAVGGALAQKFGILPIEADIRGAIQWAWRRFFDSPDALALAPDKQAVINIRRYIAERWDVSIKAVEPKTGINSREAVGWYDDDTVYLPTDRVAEAAGGILKERRIAAVLDQKGHLSRRGDKTRIAIRWIPKIGHIDCYALRRSEFGRTDADTDPDQLHVMAGDD